MASDGLQFHAATGGSPMATGVPTRSSPFMPFGGIGGFGASAWGQPTWGQPTWGQPAFGGFGGFGAPTWGRVPAFFPYPPMPISSVERNYGFVRAPTSFDPVALFEAEQRNQAQQLAQQTASNSPSATEFSP